MKKNFPLALLLLCFSCSRQPGPDEIRTNLSEAMIRYLYTTVNNDSSQVKFRTEEVIYYEDVKYYDCEFKVRMLPAGGKDTLGSMRAFISKDFKEVKRTY